MITTKQRAKLRGMANTMEVILYVGKEGVTPMVIAQAGDALKARELIKGTVQQEAPVDAREAVQALCAALDADPVQVIGRRFVLYKRNEEDPRISLD